MHHSLKYLTLDDRALITESSHRVTYKRNQVVISKGEDLKQSLFTISSGVARVEINGITVTRLGAGAVLGELSFLDRSGASASVIADSELGVDVIDGDQLNNFLSSVPGFATRFYASLSLMLSQRLRETTSRISSDTNILSNLRRRKQHAGCLNIEEIPEPVMSGIKEFRTRMNALSEICHTGGLSVQESKPRAFESCNGLYTLLTKKINNYPEKASGLAGHIFRESFPYMMLSCINDRAYTKPLGYGGDYELQDMICTGEPNGDGMLGRLIDEWVLHLPFAKSIRERKNRMIRLASQMIKEWQGAIPMPILYLSIATSRDIPALLAEAKGFPVNITCIDTAPHAFERPAREIRSQQMENSVAFVHENVMQIFKDRVFLGLQKVIFGPNILDYIEDNHVVELLDWAYKKMLPNSLLILVQTHEQNPDRVYLEHILEWPFHYRSRDSLRRLFARSKFGDEGLDIKLDPNGVQMDICCRKQGGE